MKVLQINGHAIKNRGVEKLLLDVYKEIDKTKVKFDFLTPLTCENDEFRKYVYGNGGKIIELRGKDNKLLNKLSFISLYKFLKKEKYPIIHIHTGNVLLMSLYSLAGRLSNTEHIFVHAHNSADMKTGSTKKTYKNYLANIIFRYTKPRFFACSKKAAEYMFPSQQVKSHNYTLIPNGIYTDKFKFNATYRDTIRYKLGVEENQLLIGHIGQFIFQKNHSYIIKIAENMKLIMKNFKILLIGEGNDVLPIKDIIKSKGLEDYFIFYGISNEIEKMLSSMDVFILPSYFEGFPIVGVEAQANGVKCIFSQTITKEIKLLETTSFINIGEDNIKDWISELLLCSPIVKEDRNISYKKIERAGYNLKNTANIFLNEYLRVIENE